MPFDYARYQQKVNHLSTEELQLEWENYTREIAGGSAGTASSVVMAPLTGGVSLIGLGLSAPKIHNARKKREIIEAGLKSRGADHTTRKRDIAAPVAITAGVSVLTFGLATPGAEMLGGEVGAKGVEYVVAHAALDGAAAVGERKHGQHEHHKAKEKLALQQTKQNYQMQQTGQQVMINGQPQMMMQPMVQAPQGMVHLPGVAAPPGMVAMLVQPGHPAYQQPQILGQNQKPLYLPAPAPVPVPVPTPQVAPMSFAPASHQQGLPQQAPQLNTNFMQTPPQYQQMQKPLQPQVNQSFMQSMGGGSTVASGYPSEKQGATYAVQPEAQGFPPSSEPLPLYSPQVSSADPSTSQNEKPSAQSPQIIVNELPVEVPNGKAPETAESAMEQEITFLKARLLQMELEKRGVIPPVAEVPREPETPIIVQPSGGLGCSDHEASAASAMPSRAPTPAASIDPKADLLPKFPYPPVASQTSINHTPPPLNNDGFQAVQNASIPPLNQQSPPHNQYPQSPTPQSHFSQSPPPIQHPQSPPTHNQYPQSPPPQSHFSQSPPPPIQHPQSPQQQQIPVQQNFAQQSQTQAPPGPPQFQTQPQYQPQPPMGAPPAQNIIDAQTPYSQNTVVPVQTSKPCRPEILQHQDSGYFSQPPSRHQSVSSLQQYTPTPQPSSRHPSISSISQYTPTPQPQIPQQYSSVPLQTPQPQTPVSNILSPVSPQTTGSTYNPSQHRYNPYGPSTQSDYTPASTPGSAMCFPPPPSGKQDYFPQQRVSTPLPPPPPQYQPQPPQQQPMMQTNGQMYSPQQMGVQAPIQVKMQLQQQMYAPQQQQQQQQVVQQQPMQGMQGWQWGTQQQKQGQQMIVGQPMQQGAQQAPVQPGYYVQR